MNQSEAGQRTPADPGLNPLSIGSPGHSRDLGKGSRQQGDPKEALDKGHAPTFA